MRPATRLAVAFVVAAAAASSCKEDGGNGTSAPPDAECPTALPSCVAPAPPLEALAVAAPFRWVGWLPGALADPFADPCPPPQGAPQAWRFGRLFPPDPFTVELGGPDTFEPADQGQGVFCFYEWGGPFPLDGPPLEVALEQLPTADLQGEPLGAWLDGDLPVVVPLAGEALAREIKADLAEAALAQQGALPAAPAAGPGAVPVIVAVVDSALPDRSGRGLPGPGQLLHGRDMGLLVRRLACPDNPGPVNTCPVRLTNHLALDLEPDGAGGARPNRRDGGFLGTVGGLASAVSDATTAWLAQGIDSRLVLNLSVGWEDPLGLLPAGSAPVRALRAALASAVCRGALVLAAAGNDRDGPTPSVGPMLPAAWESVPAPSDPRCAAPGAAAYRPLVHAVGGVDAAGAPIANARRDARPRLAAWALQVPFDDRWMEPGDAGPARFSTPVLTGSSVAAAAASAAAALVWRQRPDLAAADVAQRLYDGGEAVPGDPPADLCLGGPPCDPVRRLGVCGALREAAPALGLTCAARPASNPRWTPAQQDGARAEATVRVDLGALTAYRLDVCTDDFELLAEPLPVLPAFPCPDTQLYNALAQPTVEPQPGVPGCDVCSLDLARGAFDVRVNPGLLATRLDDLVLKITTPAGRAQGWLVPGTFRAGDVISVRGLGAVSGGVAAVELLAVTEGFGGAPTVRSEQVLVGP